MQHQAKQNTKPVYLMLKLNSNHSYKAVFLMNKIEKIQSINMSLLLRCWGNKWYSQVSTTRVSSPCHLFPQKHSNGHNVIHSRLPKSQNNQPPQNTILWMAPQQWIAQKLPSKRHSSFCDGSFLTTLNGLLHFFLVRNEEKSFSNKITTCRTHETYY